MSVCPSEEKFPLLLLYDQKPSKQRRILIDKGRYHGIASGATTVITQWPGHLTSCWTTAIIIVLAVMLVSTMMLAVTLRPTYMFGARCHSNLSLANQTEIHLVHASTPWDSNELNTLQQIALAYPDSKIRLIMIYKENQLITNHSTLAENKTVEMRAAEAPTTKAVTKRLKRSTTRKNKKFRPWDNVQFNINIGTRHLLKMMLKKRKEKPILLVKTKDVKTRKTSRNIRDLLAKHPNVNVENTTYEEIFANSPLFLTWHRLNEPMKVFAVRVVEMWNRAGITFGLPSKSPELLKKYKRLITVGLTAYENLPEGLVTIDDEGFHMETKTACHVYFEELMTSLRKAKSITTPSDVIKKTLNIFCKRGAVNEEYCKTITR